MGESVTCLRSFKYHLSRKALETMYRSFILPQLDYADVIWDNCSLKLGEELESLHLDAIRTIIGAVRGTSHQKLYTESGFTTLRERRFRHKIIMYHKIVQENTPTYLKEHLPPLVSSTNPYHRRRPLQRQVPKHKTETYRQSFFPSTTTLWNNLPENIQRTKSVSQVKHFLSRNDTRRGHSSAVIDHTNMSGGKRTYITEQMSSFMALL